MTTLTSPHDLLAAIPFLIGYHPIDSLVLVSIKDDCVGMAMRIDYPIDQSEATFDLCASHISAEEAEGALIVAYQPHGRSDGDDVLAQMTAALSRAGIAIYESILIAEGTFRSVLCHDITCCPLEGRPVPPLDSSRIAMESVVAGHPMPFATFADLGASVRSNLLAHEEQWLERVQKSYVDPTDTDLNNLQRDGATAVIDENKKVLGIITDGDIRRMLETHHEFQSLTAKDIYHKNPITIAANVLAIEAAKLMEQKDISQIIVTDQTDQDMYKGIIHIHDLMKEGII